jgi:hypothetical protein
MVDDYYYALEFVHASVVRIRVLAYVLVAALRLWIRCPSSKSLWIRWHSFAFALK